MNDRKIKCQAALARRPTSIDNEKLPTTRSILNDIYSMHAI